MIEQRGNRPSPFEAECEDAEAVQLLPAGMHLLKSAGKYVGEYCQDHAPIREHTEVVGHAVRAMYFYIAAAELADGLNDAPLEEAIERTWANLTGRRMYITGGIGPSASNEGFTTDYDLPNLTAYAETCAAIGLVFWGHQLLEMTADSDYADVIERALYNGVLSGISLSGDRFFYVNPLESRGKEVRSPWFTCACCPPNIARLIANVGKFVGGASEDTFTLHVPVGLDAKVELNGVPTSISVKSDYPWSGKVEIRVSPERPVEATLAIRSPGWCDNIEVEADWDEEADYESGYMLFKRVWSEGDVLKLDLEMMPKWNEADPRVRDNLGRMALSYGPLIYCAEQHDLGFAPQLFTADPDAEVSPNREDILGGVVTMEAQGTCEIELFVDALYAELGATDAREAVAKFIPYYAWNNRGATNMQVWVRRL
jgi:DUF1680 family protein